MYFGLWKSQLLDAGHAIPKPPFLIYLCTRQLISLKTNELQRLNDVSQEDIIAFVGGPWIKTAWHTGSIGPNIFC